MKKVIVILSSSITLFAACSQDTQEANYTRCPQANSKDVVSTVTDVDGNTYKTIKIGDNEWFASNLKTTKLNDGTPIKNIANEKAWSEAKDAAYATYNNEENAEVLYNWAAASSDKLCPEGWTVPEDADWLQLAATYANVENATGWDKVPTTIGWDASGFQASASGFRERNGVFYEKDKLGLWWTKNHHNEQNAMYILMKNVSTDSTKKYLGINISHIGRTAGLSVRCVRKYSADNAQKEVVDTVASAIADSLLLSAKK